MDTSHNRSLIVWASVTVLVAVLVLFASYLGPLVTFPDAMVIPVTDPMNIAMRWFVDTFGWFFKAIAWLFDWNILFAKSLLHSLPWAAWFVVGRSTPHCAQAGPGWPSSPDSACSTW
ncbi:MAG: hypothetical protein GDA36_00140 [Rhodobacteraceae bacterium]|nr:hypothetical protein [Paracoccaceae bacterium]